MSDINLNFKKKRSFYRSCSCFPFWLKSICCNRYSVKNNNSASSIRISSRLIKQSCVLIWNLSSISNCLTKLIQSRTYALYHIIYCSYFSFATAKKYFFNRFASKYLGSEFSHSISFTVARTWVHR